MKLSVCMIVKNEEKVLGRLLFQAKKFADEIIVVDTGSTDNTKKIAAGFTDDIYDFEWRDDFSAARNFSFDKATCQYIMWLDADDVISDDNVKKIQKLKEKDLDVDVFMMKYQVAFDEKDSPTFEYYRERIVKNLPSLRWGGFVHEAIAMRGKVEYFDIAIQHRKVEHLRDVSRNLRIYEKHLANGEKLDSRGLFYYSRELYFNNRIDDAIVYFSNFLKEKDTYLPNKIDAHLMLSKCYVLKNDLVKAREILIDSMKIANANAEICCALGEIYEKQNDFYSSIFWNECATKCQMELKSGGFIQRDFYDFIPFLKLCCLYYKIGDFEKFKFFHEKAKALKPTHPSIVFNEQFVKHC